MPDITLASEPRTDLGSRPSGRMRRGGKVPAVVYGLGNDTVKISVPARDLGQILAGESGANTLINLDVAGEDMLTLVRQIQRHPTRGELLHVDFIRISRDIAVSADIPLHLTGEAAGVLDGGLLEQLVFNVTIEAMPGNIPVSIELDVSSLAIGDQVRLSDVSLPEGVATALDSDTVLAVVTAPRVVLEEVEGEEGEEGEAGEGGEAPAADASEGDSGEE